MMGLPLVIFPLRPSLQGFLLWTVGLFLLACQADRHRQVDLAFYHWQTEFELDSIEREWLGRLEIRQLYVKYFDIDWDPGLGMPAPLATVEWSEPPPPNLQITPAVFITNRCLQQLPADSLPQLASRIRQRIERLHASVRSGPPEFVQMDCDWSGSTKEKYFQLLKHLRSELPKETRLSATIRLHQVRHPKTTGLPPVARGMLMYYNMGEVDQWESSNSILDTALAAPYLQGLKNYPLPLDIALPVFGWGVVFRDNDLFRIINNLDSSQLVDNSRFRKTDSGRYEVLKSTYLQGYYLYKGDKIRLERAEASQVISAAKTLSGYFVDGDFTLSWYHLDAEQLKHLQYEDLEKAMEAF